MEDNSRDMQDPSFFRRKSGPNGGVNCDKDAQHSGAEDTAAAPASTDAEGENGSPPGPRPCPRPHPLALVSAGRGHIILSLASGLSFPNCMLLDIAARLPRLLPWDMSQVARQGPFDAEEAACAVRRANSFMQFLDAATKRAMPPRMCCQGPMQLVEVHQMDTLLPGKLVAEEIGDILLGYLCRLLGAFFSILQIA